MYWVLFSCLFSMEVSDQEAKINVENRGLPSCNKRIGTSYSSALQISIIIDDQRVGSGSGNYFKMGKYEFIITAAHVVSEGEAFALQGEDAIPLRVIYNNPHRDIAIVVPEGDLDIKPQKLKINKKEFLEGTNTNYTGYPSDLGKSVFSGLVSRSAKQTLLIQSFALPGSSGSVVFDNKGRVLGVVSAVKLVGHPYSPHPELVETLLYVERLSFISKKFLKEVFMNANRRK